MKQYKRYYKRPGVRRRINTGRFIVFLIIAAAIVVGVALVVMAATKSGLFKEKAQAEPTESATQAPAVEQQAAEADADLQATDVSESLPHGVGATKPGYFGFETDVEVDGSVVQEYNRQAPISFGDGSEYTELKGITTFRGNNYRDTAGYGTANISEQSLTKEWDIQSGSLTRWIGSGWTGQPLVVEWDADMRQMMNMNEEKKNKDDLVEVIYPTMDGKIYFLDIDDGSYTRDPIDMGFSVKGTATLDPRGYPLLYVGQGVGMSGDYAWDNTYMYVYSLIDGQVLWKYGAEEKDPFAYRDSWQAYDSSPLVATDADTLIWPGENGVLYTIVLNSSFDRAAGVVSVTPSAPVKYRYTTPLNKDDAEGYHHRWWGMESSASIWENYLYVSDNGGWMQCIDLNTMELAWAQDVTDDTDCSTVLEVEGDRVYLYTASEVDKQVDVDAGEEEGIAYVRKLDGLTGEVLWEHPYTCMYVEKTDGGVLATPVLGKNDLDGLVIFSVCRVEDKNKGQLIAYDKNSGEVVWQQEMKNYSWSSPVDVYTADGKGYIIHCDSKGDMVLRDGKTGEILDKVNLGENVEASPSVFRNMVVVGTKGERICGVRIG